MGVVDVRYGKRVPRSRGDEPRLGVLPVVPALCSPLARG